MPATPAFQPSPAGRCPACSGPVIDGLCPVCDLHRLTGDRAAVAAEAPSPGADHRLQYLLLSLGALCLVVAVITFGAVAWNRMNAAGQGAVLAAGTLAAGAAALATHRRGLRATAEALFTVAAAGALVDIQAVHVGILPDTPEWIVWSVGTAVLALAAWAFDRSTPLVSARGTALVLAQLPGLFLVAGPEWGDVSACSAILVAQSTLVLGLLRVSNGRLRPRALKAIPIVGATLAWAAGTSSALFLALLGFPTPEGDPTWFSHSHNPWLSLAVFGAGGLVALGVSLAWSHKDLIRGLGTLAASAIVIITAVLGSSYLGPVSPDWLVLALGGAVLVVLGAVLPPRWRHAPAIVGVTAAGIGFVNAVPALLEALTGAGWASSGEPWRASIDTAVRSLVGSNPPQDAGPAALVLLVPLAIAAAAWWRNVVRPVAAATIATAIVVATAAVPVALDAPVWVAVLAPLVLGLMAVVAAAERAETRLVTVPVALAGLALGAAWASVSSVATIASLSMVLLAAVALAWAAMQRNDSVVAVTASASAIASCSGLAVAVAATQGANEAQGWLVATLVTTVASAAAWWLALPVGGLDSLEVDSETPSGLGPVLRSHLGLLFEVAAVAVHVLALSVVAGSDAAVTGWVLLSGAVAMAVHATRTDRRYLVWAAAAEAMAFLWLRLAISHVAVVEAYTAPLAAVLLLIGAVALYRDHQRSSWDTMGAGLALALAPTVALSIIDPGPVRPLVAALLAAAVLLAGVFGRFQAAVTIGALAVGIVATRQLLPAASGLPPFLVFGVIGAALLAVGATFEQRRRDLVDLRDRFESLR